MISCLSQKTFLIEEFMQEYDMQVLIVHPDDIKNVPLSRLINVTVCMSMKNSHGGVKI